MSQLLFGSMFFSLGIITMYKAQLFTVLIGGCLIAALGFWLIKEHFYERG